jgi:hypothetical protein
MRTERIRRSLPSTVHLRLGRWLEARGTGWGVAVVPLLVFAMLVLPALRLNG